MGPRTTLNTRLSPDRRAVVLALRGRGHWRDNSKVAEVMTGCNEMGTQEQEREGEMGRAGSAEQSSTCYTASPCITPHSYWPFISRGWACEVGVTPLTHVSLAWKLQVQVEEERWLLCPTVPGLRPRQDPVSEEPGCSVGRSALGAGLLHSPSASAQVTQARGRTTSSYRAPSSSFLQDSWLYLWPAFRR